MFRRLVVAALLLTAVGTQAAWAAPDGDPPAAPPADSPIAPPPDSPPNPPAAAPAGSASDFWLASPSGDVWGFGAAVAYGSPGAHATSPIVGVAATPDGHGYWLVAADGGLFAYGDAPFLGSAGGTHLHSPIVGMAATHDGAGYWMVAADGGIFAFGDAPFLGSTGAIKLNKPIVGMAATSDDGGYWLVASDGGIFSFGKSGFYGSTGAITLNQPIVSMTATPDNAGYWMLAADGGVFNFGDAAFAGATAAHPSLDAAERIVANPAGTGYWVVAQNGQATGFGDAAATMPRVPTGLVFRPVTTGDRAVLFAMSQLGKPYVWGGNGPNGYDCSGLVLASWEHAGGVGFARIAADQFHTAGAAVAMTDLAAGDLVFWGSNAADWRSVYHAAMYVGGGQIVQATGDHVQLSPLGQWGTGDLMPVGRRPAAPPAKR